MPYARAILLGLLVVFAIALAYSLGAFGDGRPKQVPVSGIVTIDGKPLTAGYVRVFPAGYRQSTGAIGIDGRFTLSMFEPGDGCTLGKHSAAVVGLHVINGGAQQWLAPKKYADATTSGLTVDITGPTDELQIHLSWDGGKPFIENTSGEVIEPKSPKEHKATNANQL